ncbi:hypothetical protein Btru_065411 [Bulinus truncatus]|nr:hypothetical protein Btru_065411 [Bulinus truncatus]
MHSGHDNSTYVFVVRLLKVRSWFTVKTSVILVVAHISYATTTYVLWLPDLRRNHTYSAVKKMARLCFIDEIFQRGKSSSEPGSRKGGNVEQRAGIREDNDRHYYGVPGMSICQSHTCSCHVVFLRTGELVN